MTIMHKQLAVLTAAVLLLNGSAAAAPVPGRTAKRTGIAAFVSELLSGRKNMPEEPFAELCFDSRTGQLLRDGSSAGQSCGGFSAAEGTVTVQKAATMTQAELDSGADTAGTVSLAEAAGKIGCTYLTENGQTVVSSPYQSCTLIVRANGSFDLHGGTDTASGMDGLHVLQYPTAADAYAACCALRADDHILLAEPEMICHVCGDVPDEEALDAVESGEWGYQAVGCDVFTERLDAENNPKDPLCVAVLDTGISAEHSLFRGRIAAGGCSFVPDVSDASDDNMHGTLCAGIIARCTRENVKILPLKVLDREGYGSTLQIYCAMLYAAEMGADVVNMSMAGKGLSLLLQESADMLSQAGIPCIAAAGNDAWDVMYSNPANISSVIAVASVTSKGSSDDALMPEYRYAYSQFSNYGKGIDFCAPGASVRSAYYQTKDSYTTDNGTSMAAPFVTACYANLLDCNHDLRAEMIYEYLRLNAVDLGEPGRDMRYGCGMVCMKDFVFADQLCEKPEASPDGGHFSQMPCVSLSCETPGAEIYYTLDSSLPDRSNGILYDGTPLQLRTSATVKAVAYYGNRCSAVLSSFYCIDCPMPEVTVSPGAYADTVRLQMKQPESGSIYYTLDGSCPDPETASEYCGEIITLSETTLIGAVTVIGDERSEVLWAGYEIGGQAPERLMRIEGSVLEGCYFTEHAPDIGALAGDREITEIAPHAFTGKKSLTAVTLPDTVKVLGDGAFENCPDLCTVTAKGVQTLGSRVFAGCESLEKISLGSVTEIPDQAFYRCSALRSPELDLSRIRSVGDYAFAKSACSGQFDLAALETVGRYAFSDMDELDLILPPTITVLPEGLCRNVGSLKMTAKGAAEIGAFAFCSEYAGGRILRLEIPFGKITAIGSYAFYFADLNDAVGGQIFFSSLTELDQGAFRHAVCRGMAFPKLRTVFSDTFRDIRTEVLRLDAAEQIGSNAVVPKNPDSCCLIFGSSKTAFADDALGDPKMFAAVAAPAMSDVSKYCNQSDHLYPFRETPDLFIPEMKQSPARLTAVPLGIGLQAVWQPAASLPAAPASDMQMLFADLDPYAMQNTGGTWKAVLWENGAVLRTGDAITADPSGFIRSAEIRKTDDPVLLIWDDLLTPEEQALSAGRPLQIQYTFQAPRAGNYVCYAEDPSASLTVETEHAAAFEQKGSGKAPELLASVSLAEGETVTMILRDPGERKANAVTVCEYFPKRTLADAEIRLNPAVQAYVPDAPLPDVVLTDRSTGTVLQEGTDYVLLLRNAGRPGITEIYAAGIGMYAGMLSCTAGYYETLSEDAPAVFSADGGQHRLFRFAPQESGLYVVSLTPWNDGTEQLTVNRDAAGAALTLLDSELKPVTLRTMQNSTDQLLIRTEAGKIYDLSVNPGRYGSREFQLRADPLQDRLYLGYSVFRQTEQEFTGAETAAPPEVLCYPAEQMPEAGQASVLPEPVVLTEGRDFTWELLDPLLPGKVRWLLTGTGNCTGRALQELHINCDFSSASEIRLHEPFSCGGDTGLFVYTPKTEGPLPEILSEDGSAFAWACYFENPADGTFERCTYAEAQFRTGYDKVFFALRPDDGKQHSYLLDGSSRKIPLSDAETEPVTLVYTGQQLCPGFRVTYQGQELKEKQDYEVHYDRERLNLGRNDVKLYGIGAYSGILNAEVIVEMPDPDDLPLLTCGSISAEIRQPGETLLYCWIPEERSCCLKKTSMPDASVRLLNRNGTEIGCAGGIGVQSTVIPAEPGIQYYIAVSLADPGAAGTVRLEVQEGRRMLKDCEITGEKQLLFDGSEGLLQFSIRDGDILLQENTDYTVLSDRNPRLAGNNVIYIRGKGIYTGEVRYEYTYLYRFADLPFAEEAADVTLDQDVFLREAEPGHKDLFRFTAPEDGTYYLDTGAYDSNWCTMLRYWDNGSEASASRLCFPLKQGESVWFASVTNWVESDKRTKEKASFRVTAKMPLFTFWQDGYRFATEPDGTFSVDRLPPNQCGYVLPETVTDPETGVTCSFYEIVGSLTWTRKDIFVGRVTIYGTPGGAVEAFCDENDYCFSALDPDCSVRGDLTGDGLVNKDDIQTLSRWLAEGGGMMLPGRAAEAADLDGDGCITISDLWAVMQAAKE